MCLFRSQAAICETASNAELGIRNAEFRVRGILTEHKQRSQCHQNVSLAYIPKSAFRIPHDSRFFTHNRRETMSPLWQLTLARLREFFREPAALLWVYGFPLVLAITLGMAFRDRPVEQIRVDIRNDGPGGVAAAERLSALLATDERFAVTVSDQAAVSYRLRVARTDLVVIPAASETVANEFLLDVNRTECVLARAAVESLTLRQGSPVPPPEIRTVEEPGGRYIDFLLPGLLGINLMAGGLFGVGFLTVDMRVRNLLKRYVATPMKRSDFLLSLMLSRLIFTISEVVLLLGFAYLFFEIRVRGDFLAFLTVLVVGGISFCGLGLLIASRTRTIEAASGFVNLAMLPMYILSGVFFSADRFPDFAQPFIQSLPLTALNNALRAIMNDGAGWAAIVNPLAILLVWGIGCFTLALKIFRWK